MTAHDDAWLPAVNREGLYAHEMINEVVWAFGGGRNVYCTSVLCAQNYLMGSLPSLLVLGGSVRTYSCPPRPNPRRI